MTDLLRTGDALAEFAVDPGEVPTWVLEQARMLLIDSVGCAIGGLGMTSSRLLLNYAAATPGPAVVLGSTIRTSSELAAFVNGQLVNSQDFDAVSSAGHDVPVVVASAIAAVERVGGNGLNLLVAIAVGLEVSTRLASLNREHAKADSGVGYVGNPLFVIAAAAAAASALGLPADKCRHALALAVTMRPVDTVAPYFRRDTMTMAKYAIFGQLAESGYRAARLAAGGFTAPGGALELDSDLWRVIATRPWPPFSARKGVWMHEVRFKEMPTNLPTIGVKAAFRDLIAEHSLKPDEIRAVHVESAAGVHPLLSANRLKSEEDRILHIGYQLACMAHGVPPTRWLADDMRDRSDIREFASRVDLIEPRDGRERVIIVSSRGKFCALPKPGDGVIRSPLMPSDRERIIEKFVSNTTPRFGEQRARETAADLARIAAMSKPMRILSV